MKEENTSHIIFHISTSSILKVIGFLVLAWFIFYVKDIVLIVFVATLLAVAFNPVVGWLSAKKIPRPMGIVIIYLFLFILFFGIIAILIPPLRDEITQIANYFPALWEKFMQSFPTSNDGTKGTDLMYTINQGLSSLKNVLINSTGNVYSFILVIFGNIITFILIFVLTFYFLLQEQAIKRAVKYLIPSAYQQYFDDIVPNVQDRIGRWLRGELILVLVVGLLILVGLKILNVKYFLVLALLAGIMEIIPYVGPFFSAIPAAFIAFSDSIWKGISVIILYWVVQQMENHIIVPKVMQKAVGLNPIIIIIAILIGAKLFGFLGVLIAVPTTAAFSVITKYIYDIKVLGKNQQEVFKE